MKRILSTLEFSNENARNNFLNSLETRLSKMKVHKKKTSNGTNEKGNPNSSLDIAQLDETEADDTFNYVTQQITNIPMLSGTITLHECDHADGGASSHDCGVMIANGGRQYQKQN